jgi:hypothetical protein
MAIDRHGPLHCVHRDAFRKMARTHNKRVLTKIRPLHDRNLAKRLAEEEKTSGGLFIPDNA